MITPAESLKRVIYENLSLVPKALANPRRLEIIDLLAQAEMTVENLAKEAGQSIANTSQHLQVLRRAGLVDVRREGTYAHYRLAGDEVHQLWQGVRNLAEARLANMDRLLDDLRDDEAVESLSLDELRERVAKGTAVLVDVRPAREYAAGHIEGALSIPLDELLGRLAEIPRGKEVIAYCRGPYCTFADQAVSRLLKRGIPARRLREGFPEWRTAGLPEKGKARRAYERDRD